MKILHLSTHDADRGAARGALRLHRALLKKGVKSRVLVQQLTNADPEVDSVSWLKGSSYTRYRLLCDQIPTLKYGLPVGRPMFSTGLAWGGRELIKKCQKASLVHLHWVNKGFLPIKALKSISSPIVWTLRDMWPFTGGCHYDSQCGRYKDECGRCPILGSKKPIDLSRKIFNLKSQEWRDANIYWVAISRWIAKKARLSPIIKPENICVIPNAIDTSIFQASRGPLEKEKQPAKRSLIGFASYGATTTPRKGFTLLVDALNLLKNSRPDLQFELLVAGAENSALKQLNFPATGVGTLKSDAELVNFYSGLDVFVSGSFQEALGNSAIEASSCSVPCVSFADSGTADVIKHRISGWLCDEYTAESLCFGIEKVLENRARRKDMGLEARRHIEENFSPSVVANRYIALYEQALKKKEERLIFLFQCGDILYAVL